MKKFVPKRSKVYAAEQEIEAYKNIVSIFKKTPIPDNEILENISLFFTRPTLAQLLFMHEIYKKILKCHGVIMEFGVRWGRNLSLFSSLRTIYEPHNFSRKLVGFDTFEGFPPVSIKDGDSKSAKEGLYSVTKNYDSILKDLLTSQEQLAPRSHFKKFEIVKGDVSKTLPEYLKQHPETIIALAYFDLDLYEPTKKCLESIKNYLVKGSVIGFDELGLAEYPGETEAVREVLGSVNHRIERTPFSPYQSFLIID